MVRRIGLVVTVILLVATPWAFAYGPLFPWSVIKPGYEKVALQRADIFHPKGVPLDPAYLKVDEYLTQAESFHQLQAPHRLSVIATANWDDFHRFSPWISGRAIAGATFETGTVIFITPKIAEKGLDYAEFLRHEIAHAVVSQNLTIWGKLRLRHYTWLFEGVPVWFGQQRAYITQDEFLARAPGIELRPYFEFDANASQPASIDMRFAYVAWRNFLDYLAQQRGKDTFNNFYHAVQHDPDRMRNIFQKIYGRSFLDTVEEFHRAVRAGWYHPG